MAITLLPLTCNLSEEEVFSIVKAAHIESQGRLEVTQCFDIARIWSDWITENFGAITGLRHRSPPDDPPDVELVCEKRVVRMEHTQLQPPHLGQAQALLRKSSQGGFIPSISSPPRNFGDMMKIVSGVTPSWSFHYR